MLLIIQALLAVTLVVATILIDLLDAAISLSAALIVMTCFYAIFGCLMCVTLFKWDLMSRNFFLLKTTGGRGIFNIFVAFMLLYSGSTANIVLACCFGAIGIFFIILAMMTSTMDKATEFGDTQKPQLVVTIK
mmetsp:Transcript_32947/g.32133  ORF Transcript_32947/g.32133 Transcript_32947/m.32133 type:complete len:133 (+) Transcript_32947:27-425(+)